MPRTRTRTRAFAALILTLTSAAALLGGCASYATPGGPADLRAVAAGATPQQRQAQTDLSIAQKLELVPLAQFPTAIAAVRVQAAGYRSFTSDGYGSGRMTVVTNREVESEAAFTRLTKLPLVRGIAPLNRLVVPAKVNSDRELREAAAAVQADMLLLYTFDTRFGERTTVPAAGLITLGLFPNEEQRVTSTASAALFDTRNGYVYGLAEATSKTAQLSNAWTSREAADEARLRAETEAFDKLTIELQSVWTSVVANHARPTSTTPAAVTQVR
jgi:hypothetical protein